MAPRTNQDIGEQNYRNLAEYLERVGPNVPVRGNGDADVTAIVAGAGLTARRVIYDNTRNRDLLNAHLRTHQIREIGLKADADRPAAAESFQRPGARSASEVEAQLRRHVKQLENRVSALSGEVVELRRDMRRYEAIDMHLAETGRLPR